MTILLKNAFSKASALPEQQQDAIAQILLDEMEDEARWDTSFAKSQDVLASMAREAMIEYRAGETVDLDPDAPGAE